MLKPQDEVLRFLGVNFKPMAARKSLYSVHPGVEMVQEDRYVRRAHHEMEHVALHSEDQSES